MNATKRGDRGRAPFTPHFPLITGSFVIVNFEPDGDSIRFIADDPSIFTNLHRGYLIKPSPKDGSVQLRLEGIDATELHYGNAAQPLGVKARDSLLSLMGFKHVEYAAKPPTKATKSKPVRIQGAILSLGSDPFGRPVSYALLARDLPNEASVPIEDTLLRKTVNFQMLNSGMAYFTVYTSMPSAHRFIFRSTALEARSARRGVWAIDSTSEFVLEDQNSIGPNGACILPKLFRRCTDYLKAVNGGFRGNLKDWILSVSTSPTRNENDQIIIWNFANPHSSVHVHLADLIDQRNRTIVFQGDMLDLVVVEK